MGKPMVIETTEVNGVFVPTEEIPARQRSTSSKATPAPESRQASVKPRSSRAPATAASPAVRPLCVTCGEVANQGLKHAFGVTPLCDKHANLVSSLVVFQVKPVQIDLTQVLIGIGRLVFGG